MSYRNFKKLTPRNESKTIVMANFITNLNFKLSQQNEKL